MIDQYIEKIIQNPLFLKLKTVVENNGYHNHEDVYSHLLKTKNIAIEEISGGFITNSEAKEMFLKFVNEDLFGFKRADIMVLIALLHDIGKVLYVKDNQSHSILITDSNGITSCPGHEYWGSTILEKFLEGLDIPSGVKNYMANVIRLHDTFNEGYMTAKKDWDLDRLVYDVKARAEGLYKEALFNIYCDCFTALPYQLPKESIIEVFNEPKLYGKREYIL